MIRLRSRFVWLTCLALACAARPCWADPPPDPLRLIPAEADALVKIENARQLVEAVYNLEALKELQKFDVVKEYYNSTNVKRFNQLVEYFEKKIGAKKYELLDQLAGGGVAFGLKIEPKPKAVLVVQGKDEQATEVFFKAALQVLQQELERQGKKEKIAKGTYEKIETYNVGPEFHLARVGAAIIMANHADFLKASLNLHLGKGGQSLLASDSVQKARKLLPKEVHAWGWLNLNSVRKIPETKDFFESPEKVSQINVTFLGGFIDVAKRSEFACFGLYRKDNEFTLTVQFPEGTKGMSPMVAGWFPPEQGSSLPLLEPPNLLSSTSYYLDLAEFWKNRKKVLLPKELENLEKVDKDSANFLDGIKMSELLLASGAHQRIVVTQPTSSIYKRKPKVPVQSFAVVHEMRQPELGKKLDRVIRIGAVLVTLQVNVKLVEEDYKDVHIVTYRFSEEKDLPGDNQDIRFGFSPSYAWTKDQFIASSTLELCKNLIDELQKENKAKNSPTTFQTKVYSAGAAAGLKAAEEQVLTQFVLAQGISLDKAKQEFNTLVQMLQTLGTAQLETVYTPSNLKINFTLNLGK
jgi:hypothetical protein